MQSNAWLTLAEDEFQLRLCRLFIEMQRKGHSPSTIQNVLAGVRPEITCSLGQVRDSLKWNREEKEIFTMCHDVGYRLQDVLCG